MRTFLTACICAALSASVSADNSRDPGREEARCWNLIEIVVHSSLIREYIDRGRQVNDSDQIRLYGWCRRPDSASIDWEATVSSRLSRCGGQLSDGGNSHPQAQIDIRILAVPEKYEAGRPVALDLVTSHLETNGIIRLNLGERWVDVGEHRWTFEESEAALVSIPFWGPLLGVIRSVWETPWQGCGRGQDERWFDKFKQAVAAAASIRADALNEKGEVTSYVVFTPKNRIMFEDVQRQLVRLGGAEDIVPGAARGWSAAPRYRITIENTEGETVHTIEYEDNTQRLTIDGAPKVMNDEYSLASLILFDLQARSYPGQRGVVEPLPMNGDEVGWELKWARAERHRMVRSGTEVRMGLKVRNSFGVDKPRLFWRAPRRRGFCNPRIHMMEEELQDPAVVMIMPYRLFAGSALEDRLFVMLTNSVRAKVAHSCLDTIPYVNCFFLWAPQGDAPYYGAPEQACWEWMGPETSWPAGIANGTRLFYVEYHVDHHFYRIQYDIMLPLAKIFDAFEQMVETEIGSKGAAGSHPEI